MPKTKLGSEVKNYGYKKLKANNGEVECCLSPSLSSDKVKERVRERFKLTGEPSQEISEKIENITVILDPFPCGVINDFLAEPEYLSLLQAECEKLRFNEKNNDLYKFQQSAALTSQSGGCIEKLRSRLMTEVRAWIMDMMDVELEENTLDLFCAKYNQTDTLLCHDDELEGRKIAFIFYLSRESWTEKDGGLLELFNTDDNGDPGEVVRKLLPRQNSFAFFEVSPVSFHQVSEVLSQTKERLSLSGWFHGKSAPRKPRSSLAPSAFLPSLDLEEDEFFSWINPVYLEPETQGEIQSQFEENSEISLAQFLTGEQYSRVSQALAGRENLWRREGPADRRWCHVLAGEQTNTNTSLTAALRFFSSQPFLLLLSNLTGLRFHQLASAPEESEEEEEEEKEEPEGGKIFNPRCRGQFSRWSPGTYTLVRDDDQEQAEFALDLRMFFNVPGWSPEMGGQTSYIARGEDEELVTVEPEENTLSLVYRDKESLKFVKFVNSRLREMGDCFHDLFLTYYE